MVRLLLFLVLLALAAYGLAWLAENPGDVALTFHGVEYDVSLMVAIAIVVGLAIVIALAWGVIRFVFRLPSLMSLAAKGAAAREGLRRAVRRHGRGRLGRRAHRDASSPPKRASISAMRR